MSFLHIVLYIAIGAPFGWVYAYLVLTWLEKIEKRIWLPRRNSIVDGAVVAAVLRDVPGNVPYALLVEFDSYAFRYIGMLREEDMGEPAELMTIAPGDYFSPLLVKKASIGSDGKPRIDLSEKAAWDLLRAKHSRALARMPAEGDVG